MENGEWGQQLINEWTGICDDEKHYEMTSLVKASYKRMLWKCSKGHEWYSYIRPRTVGKHRCPYCVGQKATKDNNFMIWCNKNETYGQQLINEWTGVCEDGIHYEMNEVLPNSQQKFNWVCNRGHLWLTRLYNRTANMSGCPYCSTIGTSYPEQFLYRALLQIYPNTISRGKFQGYEYDISIPEEKTCIEYSGINWHSDKLDRDKMKSDICKKHNVRFIQIYAHTGQIDTEDIFEDNQIIYKVNSNKDMHNIQLTEILDYILKSFGHSISEINIEKVQTEAFNFMYNIESEIDSTKENIKQTTGIQIKPEDFYGGE